MTALLAGTALVLSACVCGEDCDSYTQEPNNKPGELTVKGKWKDGRPVVRLYPTNSIQLVKEAEATSRNGDRATFTGLPSGTYKATYDSRGASDYGRTVIRCSGDDRVTIR